jgi:hypothetical protein
MALAKNAIGEAPSLVGNHSEAQKGNDARIHPIVGLLRLK